MFQQQDIMLLTIVELIFALLVSFFIVTYISRTPYQTVDTSAACKKDLEAVRANLLDNSEKLESCREKLEINKKGLKSKQTPSCIETTFTSLPLAEITILGENEYMVDNVSYSFQRLKSLLNDDIKGAQDAGCTHIVNVTADMQITSSQYDRGLRNLEQLFYVKRLKIR